MGSLNTPMSPASTRQTSFLGGAVGGGGFLDSLTPEDGAVTPWGDHSGHTEHEHVAVQSVAENPGSGMTWAGGQSSS